MKHRALLAALVVALVVSACGGDDDDTGTDPAEADPVGLVAIGNSGLTGHNSDPDHPNEPVLENSWATGTNPEINSIYQRLVALQPEIEGHVANAAVGGARAEDLIEQATRALEDVPAPALIIIQGLENDFTCDGDVAAGAAEYGATIAEALEFLTTETPNSRILIVGWTSRPSPAAIEAIVTSDPDVKDDITGPGVCDFYNSAGALAPENFETMTGFIEEYEAAQAEACADIPQCVTDEGALAQYNDTLDKISADYTHLEVEGLAEVAELAWPVVAAFLEIEPVASS